ncbi:hypothetical protein EDD21DRAFT_372053 [Dissophora ornata]|nr:hypothetical protein BGZ58_008692 [Dissophora ornata]KAI8602388.1 hypothetical protein EDD21DRAFT_372053 [Dissophora ornata]
MSASPPPLRVQINGILLSTLLFECANARVDYEGLILGAVVSKSRSVVDDASDARVKTVYTTIVVQGVYKLEPNLPKFYGRSGQINEQVLEHCNIPSNLTILGYLKYRRTETHQLSLRDKAVALNLKMYLERKHALSLPTSLNPFETRKDDHFPVLMSLFTAKTNENRSTHDYDYTFWSIGDDESSFEAVPVDISNMIESPQEDYQSFQSNLAAGASRHSASVGMMNTIRAVPTTTLVDGHEAMYKDSFEATKSLARNVLASEQAVMEALEEIERLKGQVENSKVAASIRKRQNQQNTEEQLLEEDTENRPQQKSQQQKNHSYIQQRSHLPAHRNTGSPSLPSSSPRPATTISFSASPGSPPDLLY